MKRLIDDEFLPLGLRVSSENLHQEMIKNGFAVIALMPRTKGRDLIKPGFSPFNAIFHQWYCDCFHPFAGFS